MGKEKEDLIVPTKNNNKWTLSGYQKKEAFKAPKKEQISTQDQKQAIKVEIFKDFDIKIQKEDSEEKRK